MKLSLALVAGAAAGLAAAQPHRHAHGHHERRGPSPVADDVVVPGPTVVMYELNGLIIPESEVMEGIKNGTLVWANGGYQVSSSSPPPVAPVTTSSPTTTVVAPPTTTPSTTTTSSAAAITTQATTTAAITTSSEAETSTTTSKAAAATSDSSSSSSGTGVDTSFPDGTIACSSFPSDYGAVAVDWLNLGGWIGIQSPGSTSSGGYSDIETITESTCSGESCCDSGMFCSYACPAGYQKSQWPTLQGLTGQSVGGLECKDGFLYLTNSNYDTICIPGTDKVTIQIENKMSSSAAVCRTDYPGTESETVPLGVSAGATEPLTCPDSDNYYTWEGSATSAQYYVNPAGVSTQDACQWGSDANPWGNYAPLNLGVSYKDGSAWLSIFQNSPTTDAKLDFTVEIVGDTVSGYCKYSGGQYCSGEGYTDCSSTTGCTVSLASGTATYVFSDA